MKSSIMKYSNSFMTVVMLAIFVVLVGLASGYPPGARFMPLVVGIPAIVLCLLQLALDARERRRGETEVGDARSASEKAEDKVSRMVGRRVDFQISHEFMPGVGPEISPEEMVRREMMQWGYFLGFIAGIILFGFWVAIPVFLVAFLRFQAKAGWLVSLGLGIGASLLMYFGFERLFRVVLHTGFVTDYVLGLFGG
jgi:tripartite tricarboxylate transporter TctB family protein